jgi:hypothetical protein
MPNLLHGGRSRMRNGTVGLPQSPEQPWAEVLFASHRHSSAGSHSGRQCLRILDRDQHYHSLRACLGDLMGSLDTIHSGHAHIEEYECRGNLGDEPERLFSRLRFTDRLEAGRRGDDVARNAAENGLVIDRDNRDGLAPLSPVWGRFQWPLPRRPHRLRPGKCIPGPRAKPCAHFAGRQGGRPASGRVVRLSPQGVRAPLRWV